MVYYVFRLLALLIPLLPEKFGYWVFARVGDIAFLFLRSARSRLSRNLRHVLPEAPSKELDRVARRGFQNLLKDYFDLFRAHSLSDDAIRKQVKHIEGLEGLESAFKEGHGVIGTSCHFAGFNLLLHIVAIYFRGRYEVVVPAEHLEPEKLNRLMLRLRTKPGIKLIPTDLAGRAMIRALRSGNFLGLALDRDPTESGSIVDFFGEPARLADGAAQLALKYSAPVIVGVSRRLEDNKTAIALHGPIHLAKTGDQETDIKQGLACFAGLLEDWIRRYPDQWILTEPLWITDKS